MTPLLFVVAPRRTRPDSRSQWSGIEFANPREVFMELVVRQILGWQRAAQGCTVVLEVEVGWTVRETCRLVLPTDDDISAMQRILANALSGIPPDRGAGDANAA